MLRADGLGKDYRGHAAVADVTFAVEPGRIVGLVGANGAGKTTTLKMLAGLVEPTRGTATVDGSPTVRPATRGRIGYLPEESPLYDEETGRSYLRFFASLYGVPSDEARLRAERLLDRLGLDEPHREKPIGTLSKGMRRKVAIARCLLHEPSVLILDEPTSGLDPHTTTDLEDFLLEQRESGRATLLSAHNLPQVEKLCDEVLVMHNGRLVERGTLSELRQRLGAPGHRVRATISFPGSHAHGPHHQADGLTLDAVQAVVEAVRRAGGDILVVESVAPRLEELLRRARGG